MSPENGLRTATLKEASELESAGGRWEAKHVAAFTGYSESFIRRRKDIPRLVDGDTGRVFYMPADVRDWHDARLTTRFGPCSWLGAGSGQRGRAG